MDVGSAKKLLRLETSESSGVAADQLPLLETVTTSVIPIAALPAPSPAGDQDNLTPIKPIRPSHWNVLQKLGTPGLASLGEPSTTASATRPLPLLSAARLKSKLKRLRKNRKESQRFLIHPKSPYKLAWDLFISLLILYSVLSVPFRISFNVEPHGMDLVLDRAVDVFFGIDMVVVVFTAYLTDDDRLVLDRRKIVLRYLKSWFLVDLMSTFPMDVFVQETDVNSANALRIMKLMKAPRLLKVLRLLRLRRVAHSISDLPMGMGLINMTSLFAKIVFLAHFLSCLWFSLDTSNPDAPSWVKSFDYANASSSQQYLASLYWVIFTMMTIGYGNIHATNDAERVFSIFTQFIGSVAFGWIIATVTRIVEAMNPRATKRKFQVDALRYLMEEYGVSRRLKRRILHQFHNHLSRTLEFPDSEFVESMHQHMRTSLVTQMHKSVIDDIKLFHHLDSNLVAFLAVFLCPVHLTPGRSLLVPGDYPEEVYFIVKGTVKFGYARKDGTVVYAGVLSDGEDIALCEALLDKPCLRYYKTLSACEAYSVPREKLYEALRLYPKGGLQEYAERWGKTLDSLALWLDHGSDKAWTPHVLVKGVVRPLSEVRNQVAYLDSNMPRRSSIIHVSDTADKTEEAAGKNSGEGSDQSEAELWKLYLIHPRSVLKLRWDMAMGVLTIYSVIVLPVKIAFSRNFTEMDWLLDILLDLTFLLDMVLTTRTATYETASDTLMTDPKKILKNYLGSWFLLDFVAAFPIDMLVEAAVDTPTADLTGLKLIRGVRLFRLLKMFRLSRLKRSFRYIDEMIAIHPSLLRSIQLTIQLIFIAHTMGCLWVFVSNMSSQDGTKTWWNRVGIESNDTLSLYIGSIYWIFTTMTTVGYGDIYPVSEGEFVFCIIFMLFGATVFGYVIGSVSNLVSNLLAPESDLLTLKRLTMDYLQKQDVPKKLEKGIRRYYDYLGASSILQPSNSTLRSIPRSLQQEILMHANEELFKKVAIFHLADPRFIIKVFSEMTVESFLEQEVILLPNSEGSRVFFLVEGSVYIEYGSDLKSGRLGTNRLVKPGEFFGHEALVTGKPNAYKAMTVQNSTVLVLSKLGIARIQASSAVLGQALMQALTRAIAAQRSTQNRNETRRMVVPK